MPKEASHLLLERPWQYDRKVIHDSLSNKCSFLFEGKKVALIPLSPLEISEDQVKMRVKRQQERKEEREKTRVEERGKQSGSNKTTFIFAYAYQYLFVFYIILFLFRYEATS